MILAVFALPVMALVVRGGAALRGVTQDLPVPGASASNAAPSAGPGCGPDTCLQGGWAGANLGVYDPEGAFAASPQVAIDHLYLHWEGDESGTLAEALEAITAQERWPMLTLEPWPDRADGQDALLRDVAAGAYDARIVGICTTLAAFDRPVLLRWGHEMELETGRYPWSNRDPGEYVAAYRHVVDRCRSVASTIFYVWSPAGNAGLDRYWPGREYVDYVGLSIFSYPAWDVANFGRVRGFDENFAEKYARVAGFDRPVLIAELGVTGEPAYQLSWIKEAWLGLPRYPLVRTVVYFNAVDTELAWGAGYETPDWRIDPRVFE